MAASYVEFLASKRREWTGAGFTVALDALPDDLYPFQAVLTRWALKKGRAALWADTGLGKTRMQVAWADALPIQRALILAPLCVGPQTIAEAAKLGIVVARGGRIDILNYERLHQVDASLYQAVVLDECFIAGTPVDTVDGARPIEQVRPGDGVLNAVGYDRIVATKERRLSRLVRLTMSDGRVIHCSELHPFFSMRGLVGARMLKKGDYLYGTSEAVRVVRGGHLDEKEGDQILQRVVRSQADEAEARLRVVRDGVRGGAWADEESILREILLSEMAHEPTGGTRPSSFTGGCRETRTEPERLAQVRGARGPEGDRAYPQAQPEYEARSARQDIGHPSIDGASSGDAGREWERADATTACALGDTRERLVYGVCRVTGDTHEGLPDLLQAGHREPVAHARDRGRRIHPRQPESRGREEGREALGAWVARVEILESRSPEFRALSGGTDTVTLYDLEVAQHPSFSVHGLLVHNSSILKSLDGKTRTRLIDMFRDTPYRLCCTATPAPNDIAELANHCEFLGIMTRVEMLATFFVHDEDGWRLKGHARDAFYAWLASWGMFVRKPSDIGSFSDDGYILPPLEIMDHVVAGDAPTGEFLFHGMGLGGIRGRQIARRGSLKARCDAAVQLVEQSTGPFIVWTGLNSEQDSIAEALGSACVSVQGSDTETQKQERLTAFLDGRARVLVTKISVAGFGLNLQHCAQMAFVGIGDSFEAYYQAIRRCYRFGQTRPVRVNIIVSEAETEIVANVRRKEAEAIALSSALVAAMTEAEKEEIGMTTRERAPLQLEQAHGDRWNLYRGDCIEVMGELPEASVDLSVFSPPFQSLFTYTNSERDIGNSSTRAEFLEHLGFMVRGLLRVTKPGRLACCHIAQVATTLVTHGVIGLADLRGAVIESFVREGWVYQGEVCIDKDPQAQAIRTHSKALLFVQLKKDASWLRPALADYVLVFRKPGDNASAIHPDISNEDWIEWARPIWYGIRESDTLNVRAGRGDADERHICALQLGVIERCIRLWSNPDDLVLSPFAGIGSEGYEAVRLGRRFVGVELKQEYFETAKRNLAEAEQQIVAQGSFFQAPQAR